MRNFKKFVIGTLAVGMAFTSPAQDKKETPQGWHLMDRKTTGFYGISLNKAYEQLKGKQSKTVVVAVIDSGIDTTHEDLKPVLWVNTKEIPGNGKDDDGNGYVDDINGWNFIGGKDGSNVKEDSYEAARVYHKYKSKFEKIQPSSVAKEDMELYKMWKKAEKDLTKDVDVMNLMLIKNAYKAAAASDTVLKKALGKSEYNGNDVENYTPSTEAGKLSKRRMLTLYQGLGLDMAKTNREILSEICQYVDGEERKAQGKTTAPINYRAKVVKDNDEDINNRGYGNNDLMGGTSSCGAYLADHGTHVAGIIAAARNNNKGVDGIADNVRIMALRAVPDGDEHDKDIAHAIRYAADNGAKIINMSFGKGLSPQKHWVDDAVKYAESKGVLLVHAAGNSAADIDTTWNFPTAMFKDGQRASNWITVGASGDPANGGVVASFSNFGKGEVDVFAPGVDIFATIPVNSYGSHDGTSMASPVVAGVAALLLSYYPHLTPQQIKFIIEQSAVTDVATVMHPTTGKSVKLSEMSKMGGIVNAAEAVRLAEEFTRNGGKLKIKTDDEKLKMKDDKIKSKVEPKKVI